MASYAPIPTPTPGYSFISYPPPDHAYSGSSHAIATIPHMPDMSGMQSPIHYSGHPHFSNAAYAHLSGQAPPSPMMAHAHLPPSPVTHGSSAHSPSREDRWSSGSGPARDEGRAMKQMMQTMAKMQTTMKDMAERQEQVLDRMSVLEQRVGRIDDSVARIVETTEVALEDSRSIRTRVEDNERFAEFETRLQDLMDGVVERLINGIGAEIKDIKKSMRETEKIMRYDPFASESKRVMARRLQDAAILNEEAQLAVDI